MTRYNIMNKIIKNKKLRITISSFSLICLFTTCINNYYIWKARSNLLEKETFSKSCLQNDFAINGRYVHQIKNNINMTLLPMKAFHEHENQLVFLRKKNLETDFQQQLFHQRRNENQSDYYYNLAANLLHIFDCTYLIDVGCSSWNNLKLLHDLGYKIIGLDTEKNLFKAKQAFKYDFHCLEFVYVTDYLSVSSLVLNDSVVLLSNLQSFWNSASNNTDVNNLVKYFVENGKTSTAIDSNNYNGTQLIDYLADITIVISTKNRVLLTKTIMQNLQHNARLPIIIVDVGTKYQINHYVGRHSCNEYIHLPHTDTEVSNPSLLEARMVAAKAVRSKYVFICSDQHKFNNESEVAFDQLKQSVDRGTEVVYISSQNVDSNTIDLGFSSCFFTKTFFLRQLWNIREPEVHKYQSCDAVPSKIKFYMYQEANITMNNWDKICDYWNTADEQMLQQLERHPWRTFDANEAHIFVIPTKLYQSYKCQGNHSMRQDIALKAVTKQKMFNKGKNHVIMAHHWSFNIWSNKWKDGLMSEDWWNKLENVTATRYECYHMSRWKNSFKYFPRQPHNLFKLQWEPMKHCIVVPYGDKSLNIQSVSVDYVQWQKRTNLIWSHIKQRKFLFGGSKLRNLPLTSNLTGDVGPFIPLSHWTKGWSNSKFCLVLAGDTPTSHSFYHSLLSGCIPVIISDHFNVGVPFDIDISTFSIVVKEKDYLQSPKIDEMLADVPESVIQSKLAALKAVQPKLLYRHPKSEVATLFLRKLYKQFQTY